MSCGLGRALGNLPLFPRSAFVFTKLSGLSWRQTLPSRQLLVPSLLRFSKASRSQLQVLGCRRGHRPLARVPRIVFSCQRCPEGCATTKNFGPSPSGTSRPQPAADTPLAAQRGSTCPGGHLPHLSTQGLSTRPGVLGSTAFSRGGAGQP